MKSCTFIELGPYTGGTVAKRVESSLQLATNVPEVRYMLFCIYVVHGLRRSFIMNSNHVLPIGS